MKALLFILATSASLNLWSTELTSSEADLLVREIDNICGDTWCEGEFDFSFNQLKCDFEAQECVLDFEIIDTLFDEEWNVIGENRSEASCTIVASSKDYLFNEDQTSYSWELYEVVSECVSAAEGDVYHRLDF